MLGRENMSSIGCLKKAFKMQKYVGSGGAYFVVVGEFFLYYSRTAAHLYNFT